MNYYNFIYNFDISCEKNNINEILIVCYYINTLTGVKKDNGIYIVKSGLDTEFLGKCFDKVFLTANGLDNSAKKDILYSLIISQFKLLDKKFFN